MMLPIAMVPDYKRHRPWAENLSLVLQIGLTMAGCIVACFFGGRYLDRWLGSPGIFTVLLTLFGIIGGGVVSYRQIMETFADRSDTDSGSKHGSD
jgi:ATP synthase protein I